MLPVMVPFNAFCSRSGSKRGRQSGSQSAGRDGLLFKSASGSIKFHCAESFSGYLTGLQANSKCRSRSLLGFESISI